MKKVRGTAFLATDKYHYGLHFQKSLKMLCIIGYLHTNNRLVEEEFGFMKNLTTEKAIYELINYEIVSAFNDKLIVGEMFRDLVGLCVNHDILLSKLNFYGINDKAYE
jgi:hypothetical protein